MRQEIRRLGSNVMFVDLAHFDTVAFFSAAATWLFTPNGLPLIGHPAELRHADLEFSIRSWIIDCALHPSIQDNELDPRFARFKEQPTVDPRRGRATGDALVTPFPELTVMFQRLRADLARS